MKPVSRLPAWFIVYSILFWIALLAYCGSVRADDWSDADVARETVFVALLATDYRQTMMIADNPDKYYERQIGGIIGHHPSKGRINNWFAVATAGHILIADQLPPGWRAAFQYLSIGMEGRTVYANFRIGLR